MEVPTMLIKTPQGPVVINVSDFDPASMERWEESPPPPPTEESAQTPPPTDPPEDIGESIRRRPGRGG
jgi:hypothetical protein